MRLSNGESCLSIAPPIEIITNSLRFTLLCYVVDNTKYEANLVIIPHVLSEKRCMIFRPNQ